MTKMHSYESLQGVAHLTLTAKHTKQREMLKQRLPLGSSTFASLRG
jgi:hypothetical protein